MIAIALSILSRIWPYLLGAALLGIGYYKFDHHCNTACREQQGRADDNEAVIASLKASINAANQQAEVERVRVESIAKSAAAAASVQVEASRVVADNASAESSRLLAQVRSLTAGVTLPDGVRDAYRAGIRLKAESLPDPPGIQPAPGKTEAALTLDKYAEVCTANAVDQNRLADRYTALFAYTQTLWAAFNRKESP